MKANLRGIVLLFFVIYRSAAQRPLQLRGRRDAAVDADDAIDVELQALDVLGEVEGHRRSEEHTSELQSH